MSELTIKAILQACEKIKPKAFYLLYEDMETDKDGEPVVLRMRYEPNSDDVFVFHPDALLPLTEACPQVRFVEYGDYCDRQRRLAALRPRPMTAEQYIGMAKDHVFEHTEAAQRLDTKQGVNDE